MSSTLVIDFGQPLPLFPLGQCVLLPHAAVPLHIFEPRYRAMTRDALDSRGLIAMAVFEGDDWKQDYEGRPPVRPCVCIGYIVQHHQLPDGRYNLLLHGVCRARVDRETEHGPYRTAYLKPVEPRDTLEIDLDEHRRQLEALFDDEHIGKLAVIAAVRRWLNDEIPTVAMIDLAAMALCRETDQRYAMLAEVDPVRRAERLVHQLHELRRWMAAADQFGPALSKDGLSLN
ncbi:MAG: LON peptidase substrate-binding domain-containing protein [Phycisphaeraceae bacterium]|nr:LON peptidase substrate-binding domain-containing protein [Phycisphaeraceae bacterium]